MDETKQASVGTALPDTSTAAFLAELGIDNQMASQKLISNGYISVAQLNSVPPSAADLDMLGFTLLERNLILQTLKPPTEPTPEIESLKRKLEQVEETAKKYEQEVQALRQEVEVGISDFCDDFSTIRLSRLPNEVNHLPVVRPTKKQRKESIPQVYNHLHQDLLVLA
eukprot:TRINITY_DN330_c0_g1_i6.p1 TRINITY_DN330_c0_g1~~TRINITY_DN330_c0_g1_i6.p1  ORF type:complete len:175 (-),score=23.25 TRINITY_DN330_c0_g1_i6:314-817(-)